MNINKVPDNHVQILISKWGISFSTKKQSVQIMTSLTLSKDDPVLNEIADTLNVTIDNIIETLEVFDKFFPRKFN